MKHTSNLVLAHGPFFQMTVEAKYSGVSGEEIEDTDFFAVFSQADSRGQSIEDYLTRFDPDANPSPAMSVSIQHADVGKILRANCVSMQWEHQRPLVTLLG
jgi:hypothetical protein